MKNVYYIQTSYKMLQQAALNLTLVMDDSNTNDIERATARRLYALLRRVAVYAKSAKYAAALKEAIDFLNRYKNPLATNTRTKLETAYLLVA